MATITGTSGNDSLNGTAGNDTISGFGGNDTLLGSGGTDFYDGGAGSDTLDFRATAAGVSVSFSDGTVSGGFSGTFANIERVLGGDGADTIIGAAGAQNLSGRTGSDWLASGVGLDTLWGGAGGDSFVFRESGSANADRISDFASGADKIVLDASVMTALGSNGNFAAGDARFWSSSNGAAHDADDRVLYNTTTRQIFYDADGSGSGGAVLIATLQSGATLVATDIAVEGASSPAVIVGTEGNDSLTGTNANDIIDGLGGNDTLNGFGGDDTLLGGDGDDILVGDVGRDRVEGGAGADVLAHGHWSNDTLDGGLGGDTLLLQAAASAVTVDLAAGTMLGGDSAGTAVATLLNIESVNAGDLNRSVHVIGSSTNNFLRGGSAVDRIFGGAGDDIVYGSAFAANANGDELYGGAGNDLVAAFGGHGLLDGGTGIDTLAGGNGIDDFVFSVAPGESNRDSVAFFAPGTDKLVLDGNAFPEIGASGSFSSGDDRFASYINLGPPNATPGGFDAEDRILYNIDTGEVWYDPDGNGSRAAQRIATLQANGSDAPTLSATDIRVVNGEGEPGMVINGTSGNDTLSGSEGDDTINGFGGNDTILAGSGNDVIDGGSGYDSIDIKFSASSGVVVNFGSGSMTGSGTISFSNIERFVASNFNDSLSGTVGSQTLAGQAGADTLTGGAGNDTLWGGAGNDAFQFNGMGTANADRISDFASGQDDVQLQDTAFTGIGAEGNFAAGDARFWASSSGAAHDSNDRVLYNTSTGRLYYDADGNGSGAAQLIATFAGNPAVAATDIAVI